MRWIAVSPAYSRTGVVIAVADAEANCKTGCQHLWITHDRGGSWKKAGAIGWSGDRPVFGLDEQGREILFDKSPQSVITSLDLGETWSAVGPPGRPAPFPDFATSARVAVTAGQDYVYGSTGASALRGSDGAFLDQELFFTPTFGQSGQLPAAVLVGADKSSGLPVLLACGTDLVCKSPVPLPDANQFSLPLTVWPSSGFGHDRVIFVQSGRGIYKSTDGGRSLSELVIGAPGGTATVTAMMALDTSYSESKHPIVYSAVLQSFRKGQTSFARGGIYKSTDGGTTWAKLGPGAALDGGSIAVAVAPDGRVFAGYLGGTVGHSGLLCLVIGGSWTASCTGPSTMPSANGPLAIAAISVCGVVAVLIVGSQLRRRSRRLQAVKRGRP